MSSDGKAGLPLLEASKMLEFAAHIRDSAILGSEDPRELAARFGLPENLVRESLRAAGAPNRRVGREGGSRFGRGLKGAFSELGRFLHRRPVLTSAAVGIGIAISSKVASQLSPVPGNALLGMVVLAGIGLLIAINAIRGQARYAVLTAFAAVACGLTSDALLDWVGGQGLDLAHIIYVYAMVLFLTALASMFLCLAAMFGAFIRIRRDASEEERVDRLLLLQRIFDLQEQLTSAPASGWVRTKWQWVEVVRGHWPLVSVGSGLGIGFVVALEGIALGMPVADRSPQAAAAFGIANFVLMAIVVPALGFISGNFTRGLLAGLLFALGKAVVGFVTGGLSPISENAQDLIATSAFFVVMGGIAGVAGTIEDRGQRNRRLAAADQTTILSEIIRLQKLLQTGAAEIFVMFVDVVKSTHLKAGRDPLKVEASFRAFHDFLGRTVRHYGGSVHSISGDGAVAKFNVAFDSLAAARAIQRDIDEFNLAGNRLDAPFRVRIGLHCGHIHGELDQVVFSSVVDIAAHIEKHAPPGGVVVTDDLRDQLPDERFAQLEEELDGHAMFVVLDVIQ